MVIIFLFNRLKTYFHKKTNNFVFNIKKFKKNIKIF